MHSIKVSFVEQLAEDLEGVSEKVLIGYSAA
jgi:hypothetical protein